MRFKVTLTMPARAYFMIFVSDSCTIRNRAIVRVASRLSILMATSVSQRTELMRVKSSQ
ncbi:hypothetical protein D3C72_2107280 [compost metagenome]